MTWGRKWLLGTTALLLLLGVLFAWLVATESGARWVLARAEPALPDALTIDTVSGTLAGGLQIDTLSWNDAAANVVVEDVFVDVRILPLLSRRVYVDRLEVGAATVRLLPAADEAPSDGGLPEIRLPIDLWLLDASFADIAIESDGSELKIDSVNLAARMEGSELEIEQLEIKGDALAISVDGRARLAGNYRAAANVAWQWSDDLNYAGRLRLTGELDRYDIEHALTAPVSVASNGSISLTNGDLTLDLAHEWQDVDWTLGDQRRRAEYGGERRYVS